MLIGRLFRFALFLAPVAIYAVGIVQALSAGDDRGARSFGYSIAMWLLGSALGFLWGSRGKEELRRIGRKLAERNRDLIVERDTYRRELAKVDPSRRTALARELRRRLRILGSPLEATVASAPAPSEGIDS